MSPTRNDIYGEAGDWLVETITRKPEAFLVLAAGCALLLRGNVGSTPSRSDRLADTEEEDESGPQARNGRRRSPLRAVRRSVADAAEAAGEYAHEVTDRAYAKASSYASAASEYASDSGRYVSRRASRVSRRAQSAAGQALNRQPLAVALLGLAAGAAVAALLPPTEIEERALRPARDALDEAAARMAGNVKDAAGEAAERLQQGMKDSVKDVAWDAAKTFVAGVSDPARESGAAGQPDEGGR
jgi:hypothetical protein